jgi:hypothetical protein
MPKGNLQVELGFLLQFLMIQEQPDKGSSHCCCYTLHSCTLCTKDASRARSQKLLKDRGGLKVPSQPFAIFQQSVVDTLLSLTTEQSKILCDPFRRETSSIMVEFLLDRTRPFVRCPYFHSYKPFQQAVFKKTRQSRGQWLTLTSDTYSNLVSTLCK